MLGQDGLAERWYRLLLLLEPASASALQNLGALCLRNGRQAEGEAFKRQAYRQQRVFVEPVAGARRRVLILCAGLSQGNVPFETLMSAGLSERIKYAIDCAEPAEDAGLPPYDLVFNAVGDADAAAPMQARLQQFAAACTQPLLNRPEAVALSRRDLLSRRLAGIEGLVLPPCIRWAADDRSGPTLQAALREGGVGWPVLLRPAGTHGGVGLRRCESLDELVRQAQAFSGELYLSQYLDYRSADGCYRKYRMVFVDGRPWPYHLAIGSDWLLHYFSADMLAHAWKLEEERRFLQDPEAVLGRHAIASLEAVGRALGLHYAGIDFNCLPDGRLLVFEANATMLVHREREGGPLAHKNAAVQDIVEAFEALLLRSTPPRLAA